MKGTDLKTGDPVYVRAYSFATNETSSFLASVTKVTRTRVYVGNCKFIRANKFPLKETGARMYKHLLAPKEYWDNFDRTQEKKNKAKQYITNELPNLTVDQLTKVAELIKSF